MDKCKCDNSWGNQEWEPTFRYKCMVLERRGFNTETKTIKQVEEIYQSIDNDCRCNKEDLR